MTDNHPITPSEDVVDEWEGEWHHYNGRDTYEMFMAKLAARWGADQELEACCADIHTLYGKCRADWLRAHRRPKPPSLKEQALEALRDLNIGLEDGHNAATIRRALESLPD